MASKTSPASGRDVFVPIEGFIARIADTDVNFHENIRVSKAWLDEHREIAHLFRPITVQYDVEQATAAPGELR